MGTKGTWQRPGEGYASGWDAIFGKKPEPKELEPQEKPKDEQEETEK